LLWVGKRRTQATLRRGLKTLGPEVAFVNLIWPLLILSFGPTWA